MKHTKGAMRAAMAIVVAYNMLDRPGAFTPCLNCSACYYEHGRYAAQYSHSAHKPCKSFFDSNAIRAKELHERNETMMDEIARIIDHARRNPKWGGKK